MKFFAALCALVLLSRQTYGDAFTNLLSHYDILRTVAGTGLGAVDGVNYWQNSFEGGPATSATLSRPHLAMADDAGNIYIVDKDSHSVLKVMLDGTIHTVAGTHAGGFNGDGPAAATGLMLNLPNGLWVQGDGTFFILDTGNGRVRRVNTSGRMSTVITDNNAFTGGRGLWVKEDESLIYYADNPNVKKWRPTHSPQIVNDKSFSDLGNLLEEPGTNNLIVTDRGASRVYRLFPNGSRDPIAGSGKTTASPDGTPAISAGLWGVRAVWPLEGGYLLGTHEGSQVWFVDPEGLIHLFVDGAPGAHGGDGENFRTPGAKIAEVRSVTIAPNGNILIVENDGGFVRMINFTNQPPIVTQQPADQNVYAGRAATLRVSYEGSLPISLQWQKDGADIPGATSADLFLSNLQPSDVGSYTLFLSNAWGTALSAGAQVTVRPLPQPPAILTHPLKQVAAIGSNVTFTVTTSGTDLAYQWQRNRRPVPGANGPSLMLTNLQTVQAGSYRMVLTNLQGGVVSSNALLRVIRPVVLVSQPSDRSLASGTKARLTVRAKGTPPFTYQWFFNGSALAAANRSTLTLTNIQPAQSGPYSVRVSNAASSAASSNATLTVTAAP